MNPLIPLASLLGMASLTAAEIRWTAQGTVSAVSGGALGDTGVTSGNTVEVTMTYDSNTAVEARSYLPVQGAIGGRAWFTGAANLGITVKIGDKVWTGEMPNVPSTTNVMESVCWDFGGPSDWFNITLDAARGGTFPSFPHTGNDAVRSLTVEFRDDLFPGDLFDIHVLPNSVSNLCAMTSATGSIMAGTSTIAFTIDPTSVQVSQPRVPTSISRTETGIRLDWNTESGKSYRIEGSANLRCWSAEGIYSGTGTSQHLDLTPFATYPTRFYRIVEQ
jgi:hypothetical protein